MKILTHTILLLITFQSVIGQTDFNEVSENLLQAVINNEPTQKYQDVIADASIEDLQIGLNSETKKLGILDQCIQCIYSDYLKAKS